MVVLRSLAARHAQDLSYLNAIPSRYISQPYGLWLSPYRATIQYMSESYRPDVTRAEARALLVDLKKFAFSLSPEFERAETAGIESTRTVLHDDPVPKELLLTMEPDFAKTTFGFKAWRVPPVRRKRSFGYRIWTTVEQSLHGLDPTSLQLIEEYNPENTVFLDTITEGALTEERKAEFDLSDHELRTISPIVTRTLRLNSEAFADGSIVVYRSTTDEILSESNYGLLGDEPEENLHSTAVKPVTVSNDIEHERISPTDGEHTEKLFWEAVEPVKEQFDSGGVPYMSAVHQIRYILQGLRAEKYGI